jgi:RHS repeat-associated protein
MITSLLSKLWGTRVGRTTRAAVVSLFAAAAMTPSASQAASPDLTIGPLTIGTIVLNQNGSWTIPVTFTVTNIGTVAAQPGWYDLGYLSANGVLDNNAQSNSNLDYRGTSLAPGATYTVSANFTTSTSLSPGNYTFFVKTDGHSPSYTGGTNTDNGSLVEADETNNTSSAVVTLMRPDLTIGPLTVGTIVANQNGSWTIPVTYTVTNSGTMPALPNWYDIGYLSTSGALDNSAQSSSYVGFRNTTLAPGASYTVTGNFTTNTSTAPGNYTFFVKTDGHNVSYTGGTNTDSGNLPEGDETNNVSSVTVTLARPDLTVGPLSVGTIVANQDGSWTIPVTYTVTNSGSVTAQPNWYDVGYLAANGVLDASSQSSSYLNFRNVSLAPGATYTVSANFTASASTAPGNYTFFVKTDGHNASSTGGTNTDSGNLVEGDDTNNTSSATVTLARPDLTAGPITIGAIVANQDGSWSIPVTYTVTNSGTVAAQPGWYDIGYLSTNGALDNSSQSNGYFGYHNTVLAPGASYTVNATFTTSTSTTPGNYTFFVKADGSNASTGGTNTGNGRLAEADETNNASSATITLARSDLTVGPLTIGTIVANSNGSWNIPVTYTVTNSSVVAAQPSWYDIGYLSSNGALDNSSQSNGYFNLRNAVLAPGASYTVNATFTTSTSTTPGNYTFFVKADGGNASTGGTNTGNGRLVEADETNNASSATITLARPDLTIGPLTIGTIVANSNGSWTIPVTYTVTNSGAVAAQPGWYDTGYLSANGLLDNSSQSNGYFGYHNTVLAPGANYTVSTSFTTSTSTTPGSYTFFVKTDGRNSSTNGTSTDNGVLAEADETNNASSAAITLAGPDLAIGPLTVGTIVANSNGSWTIPVTYTVTNRGVAATQANWYDVGYLSANGLLDNNSQSNGTLNYRTTTLVPGASYTVTANFTTSTSTTPGNFTFFVKADGHNATATGGSNTDSGAIAEADETNNVSSTQVTLTGPDLAIGPLTIGTIVANQDGSWTIPVSYTVTNRGTGDAQSGWSDIGYLSSNGVLDNASQSNGFLSNRGTSLAAGASYTVNASFNTTTSTAPGNYTFFVKTDGHNASYTGGTNTDTGKVVESDETNNVSSSTVTLARPDLTVGPLTIGNIVANQNGSWTIPVTYTVTNSGAATALNNWYDMGYLSANGVLDNISQSNGTLNTRASTLAPGASYTVTANFTTSTSTTPGNYTFFVKTDSHNSYSGGTNTDGGALVEANETNNTTSTLITLALPDLTVGPLTIGTMVANSDGSWTIPVTYTVTNRGTVDAQPGWSDIGYLSSNGGLDNASQSNGYLNNRGTSLAAGASYTVNGRYTTTTTTVPGNYTFFVKADGRNASYTGGNNTDNGPLVEADETNNASSIAIVIKVRTGISLASNLNTVTVGQPLNLTATMTPAAATGAVTFKEGSTVLGTASVASGAAVLSTNFVNAGSHTVTATYGGDVYDDTVTSLAVTITATSSTSAVSLTATPNPVSADQLITFSSTVSGVNPTGLVTFKDGSTTLGSVPVSGGAATLASTLSSAGLHTVVASYAGDANNQASSASLAVTVTGVPVGSTSTPWLYNYTPDGNLLNVLDPNGHQTDYGYDSLERVSTLSQPALASGTRPVITTAYDGQDRPTKVTDPRHLDTSYTLDGLGNRNAISSPDSGSGSAIFDALGNLTSRTDARGVTTQYGYDGLNRPTLVTYASGVPTILEYDGGPNGAPNAKGRLTGITDESGSTTYRYDGFGHVLTKTQVVGSGASARTFTVAYDWGTSGESNGKLLSITYPSGSQANYGYDSAGRVSSLNINPVNANGTGTDTGTVLPLLSGIAYDGANNVVGWTWGDGTAYQRSYDQLGRLASYPLGNPSGTGSAAGLMRTVSYDGNQGILGYTHTQGGVAQPQFDQAFHYDNLDRLTDSTVAGTHYGYAYDLDGNRTTRIIGASNYSIGVDPTSNRLLQVQSPGPTGPVTYTYQYDEAGNLKNDGVAVYGYGDRGRMSSATVTGGMVNYMYDGAEHRVSKSGPEALVSTGSAFYAYGTEGHLLGEYDANGSPIYETVYFGDVPVGVMKQTGAASSSTLQVNMSNVYSDQINTPRVITRNSDQAIVWRWDGAEAFGASLPDENPNGLGVFKFNQRFPGQVYDAETGWLYNWHRDYSPALGRYAQSDPIGLDGGINTYSYVDLQPTTESDFLGLKGGDHPGVSECVARGNNPITCSQPPASVPPFPKPPDPSCSLVCNIVLQPVCVAVGVGAGRVAGPRVGIGAGQGCGIVKMTFCHWICKKDPDGVAACKPDSSQSSSGYSFTNPSN